MIFNVAKLRKWVNNGGTIRKARYHNVQSQNVCSNAFKKKYHKRTTC